MRPGVVELRIRHAMRHRPDLSLGLCGHEQHGLRAAFRSGILPHVQENGDQRDFGLRFLRAWSMGCSGASLLVLSPRPCPSRRLPVRSAPSALATSTGAQTGGAPTTALAVTADTGRGLARAAQVAQTLLSSFFISARITLSRALCLVWFPGYTGSGCQYSNAGAQALL